MASLSLQVFGDVSATPTVVNGTVYIVDWGFPNYAVDLSRLGPFFVGNGHLSAIESETGISLLTSCCKTLWQHMRGPNCCSQVQQIFCQSTLSFSVISHGGDCRQRQDTGRSKRQLHSEDCGHAEMSHNVKCYSKLMQSLLCGPGKFKWTREVSNYTGIPSWSRTSPAIEGDILVIGTMHNGYSKGTSVANSTFFLGINATTGNLLWKTLVAEHPLATTTLSPTIHNGGGEDSTLTTLPLLRVNGFLV